MTLLLLGHGSLVPPETLLLLLFNHGVNNAVGFRSAYFAPWNWLVVVLHRFERDFSTHWLTCLWLGMNHDRVGLFDCRPKYLIRNCSERSSFSLWTLHGDSSMWLNCLSSTVHGVSHAWDWTNATSGAGIHLCNAFISSSTSIVNSSRNTWLGCSHCLARALPQPISLTFGALAWTFLLWLLLWSWGSSCDSSVSVWGFLLGSCRWGSRLVRRLCTCPFDDIPTLLLFNFLDLFLAIFVDINDVFLDLSQLSLKTGDLAVQIVLMSLCLW